jgi:hypothetical protein
VVDPVDAAVEVAVPLLLLEHAGVVEPSPHVDPPVEVQVALFAEHDLGGVGAVAEEVPHLGAPVAVQINLLLGQPVGRRALAEHPGFEDLLGLGGAGRQAEGEEQEGGAHGGSIGAAAGTRAPTRTASARRRHSLVCAVG